MILHHDVPSVQPRDGDDLPGVLLKLVQEPCGRLPLALLLLVPHHPHDLRRPTGQGPYCTSNIEPTFYIVLPLQVTQSYLPRVVKPTPPPGEKKKTSTKETKAQ